MKTIAEDRIERDGVPCTLDPTIYGKRTAPFDRCWHVECQAKERNEGERYLLNANIWADYLTNWGRFSPRDVQAKMVRAFRKAGECDIMDCVWSGVLDYSEV